MWLSHILFAYNFYKMVKTSDEIIIPTSPKDILSAKQDLDHLSIVN
jgi:cytochrome c oxidase cbb3-type subunit 1